MLADMNDFVESLNTEIGFPCIHRRQKKYIVPNVEEKLDTWELVDYGQYLDKQHVHLHLPVCKIRYNLRALITN